MEKDDVKDKKKITRELLRLIEKDQKINVVAEKLELDNLELLGLINELIDQGYNIIVKEKDDGVHVINQGDFIDRETSTYAFNTDDNNEFKFVAISDTRLGAKSEQLSILHDIYKKAQDLGIKNVILCGNISAGLKPITDAESNFVEDTYGQIDYIVKNYPKYEGITTYFISGKIDDTHLRTKKINIGKRIADLRDDMVYLGEDICDISIDKTKMQVMNSKLQKTYTVSYRTQQTINATRPEDKPDILLYGGLLQMEKYNFRGVNCISVPSVCATDNEMKTKRYSNTLGAWYVTVKTDEEGKLESINAMNSPYYKTNKDDFKVSSFNVGNASKKTSYSDDDTVKNAMKLYNYVRNGMPIEDFMLKHHITSTELRGLISIWSIRGKEVELVPEGDKVVFKKNVVRKTNLSKVDLDDLTYTEVLVVSDTHFGNNKSQLHLLNDLYEEAYKRGITQVLHVGDMVDGNYTNRPESPRLQALHGFDEQVGYVADMYPYIDGMTTYYILGSHDETHYKNGQATVNNWIDRCRKDMIYLGQDIGEIKLNNVKFLLDHPGGGSADGLSYKAQKRIENLNPHTKPKILLIGHYHKSYEFSYRNVQCIQVPCLCGKTQFQQKQGLINTMGGYFLKIYSDKKGNIQYFEPEEILFDEKDCWDEFGKDKGKVKKLEIRNSVY